MFTVSLFGNCQSATNKSTKVEKKNQQKIDTVVSLKDSIIF